MRKGGGLPGEDRDRAGGGAGHLSGQTQTHEGCLELSCDWER